MHFQFELYQDLEKLYLRIGTLGPRKEERRNDTGEETRLWYDLSHIANTSGN